MPVVYWYEVGCEQSPELRLAIFQSLLSMLAPQGVSVEALIECRLDLPAPLSLH
jgi:hypothetical protein